MAAYVRPACPVQKWEQWLLARAWHLTIILLSASILARRGLCLAALLTMRGQWDNDERSPRTMEEVWLRRVLRPALTSSRRRTQRMLHSRIPKMPANGPFHHRRCLSWMLSRGHWCAAVVVDWWLVLSDPSDPVTVTRAALAVVSTLAPKRHTSDVAVFGLTSCSYTWSWKALVQTYLQDTRTPQGAHRA